MLMMTSKAPYHCVRKQHNRESYMVDRVLENKYALNICVIPNF